MPKAVFIIAFREFRDEEYFIPKEKLEAAGIEVITCSAEKGTAIGMLGGEADVTVALDELKVADYEAVIFVGGAGAKKYIEDTTAHRIAKEAIQHGRVLAAICIAPAILARAGVLKDKKATVWHDQMDRSAVKILEGAGAVFEDDPVVTDGSIITASGPDAAEEFGVALLKALH